jgi:hypothetical protein
MPLTFETVSHGKIPIGFFNIDTDMILIKNYFVFAEDFCNWIADWSNSDSEFGKEYNFYIIHNLDDIGHLMGAITGAVFSGFIGEVYKRFPFPHKKKDFKQKPEGYQNREIVEKIIKNYAKLEVIKIIISKKERTISIGDFVFTKDQFHDVIGYLWRGGMPQWRDEVRPEYVDKMMGIIIDSKHWLFEAEMIKTPEG